ncbi:hypothetical protein [Chondromyces crocatus]|nr:hypothetical protein [Chondromyces crocatus]
MRWIWIALGLALAGCGPSVEDLCDDLLDECDDAIPHGDCVANGESLERRAERAGCEDQFEAYLDCIDDELCAWATQCTREKAALVTCTGEDAWQ